MKHPTKICRICTKEKSTDEFRKNLVNGKLYFRFACKKCDNARNKPGRAAYNIRYRKRHNQLEKERRSNPVNRARFLLNDCRSSDKRRNLICDLDLAFVEQEIKKGCDYCGSKKVLITLDRINNDLGHIKNNLVPSCIRCNFIRNSMPINAWKKLVPVIRELVENDVFGEWGTQSLRRRK